MKNLNDLTDAIIGAAMEVHGALGPGLLESVYHAVPAYELAQRGLRTMSQEESLAKPQGRQENLWSYGRPRLIGLRSKTSLEDDAEAGASASRKLTTR